MRATQRSSTKLAIVVLTLCLMVCSQEPSGTDAREANLPAAQTSTSRQAPAGGTALASAGWWMPRPLAPSENSNCVDILTARVVAVWQAIRVDDSGLGARW